MDEVKVDVEQVWLLAAPAHDVAVPELLSQGLYAGRGHGREPHSTGPCAASSVGPVQEPGGEILWPEHN